MTQPSDTPSCRANACGQDPTRCPCPQSCLMAAESMRKYTRHRLWVTVALVVVAGLIVVIFR